MVVVSGRRKAYSQVLILPLFFLVGTSENPHSEAVPLLHLASPAPFPIHDFSFRLPRLDLLYDPAILA